MDKETLKKIKDELNERRTQIKEELEEISKKGGGDKIIPKFPEYGDKADENAKEIDEYSTNLATEKILINTLRDIENALKRMEEGAYGICKYCGEEIDEKRMIARPVASACIKCKTKLQKTV